MTGSDHAKPPIAANANSCDEPYTWGRPASIYLAPRQVARLLILRSRVRANTTLKPAAKNCLKTGTTVGFCGRMAGV